MRLTVKISESALVNQQKKVPKRGVMSPETLLTS
jgi:hypothetical protein